ncbi:MAG TPA: zinc-ribbon domain-containing protein [Clostridiaceae bacterium]|nr:zinc-ribbon domain-containing protein [Clostridiaceae bacterium]
MNCPKCHKSNVEGALFCSHCGEPLQSKQHPRPKYENCTNCGAKLSPDSAYCNRCGAAVIKLPTAGKSGAKTKGGIVPPIDVSTTGTKAKGSSVEAGRSGTGRSSKQDYYIDLTDPNHKDRTHSGTARQRSGQKADESMVSRRSGYSYQDDFGGDRYADGIYNDYDDHYDDYDDGFDDYEYERPRRSPARLILTIALALIALAVVIGIVTVVRQLVDHPPLSSESQNLVAQVPSTSETTLPSETTTRPTPPTTTPPTTTPPTTTTPTTESTTTAEPTADPNAITVSESRGYVIRSGPGTDYASLGLAAQGSTFTPIEVVQGEYVEGIGDQWYKVVINGQEAYIIQDGAGQH